MDCEGKCNRCRRFMRFTPPTERSLLCKMSKSLQVKFQPQRWVFRPMAFFGGYIAEDIPPINVSGTVHIMG